MGKGSAIIRNYIIRNDISKLSICVPAKISVSPSTLPTASSSQHSRPSISERLLISVLLTHSMHRGFAVSHYQHSPCHSPCQRRESHFLCLQFGLRICQSFSNRRRSFSLFWNSSSPCSPPPSSSSSEGCLSLRAPPFVPSLLDKFAT